MIKQTTRKYCVSVILLSSDKVVQKTIAVNCGNTKRHKNFEGVLQFVTVGKPIKVEPIGFGQNR